MALTFFLINLFIGLLTYVVYKLRQRLNYWQSRNISCEQPHFLLGNLSGAQTKRSFDEIFQSYYNKFKGTAAPFVGFYFFQRPCAFVLDTALVKNILIKDFNKFTDRGFYHNEKDDPLSGNLFTLDGYRWKEMRQKLSPTFTSGKMKYMFPTVIKVGDEFAKVFGDLMQHNSVFEVKELLARFATDVIGTCAFGIDCNSLRDPEAEFRIMGRRALSDQRHGRLGFLLTSSFPNFARKLHVKQTPDHIEEFFMRIVRETVALREANNIRRNDFMDQLIDLKNNKLMKFNGEILTNLTLEELAAQAFVFFAGGFETSSTTMGFALYELAQNEEIQQRTREEIVSVLEKHNQDFSYDCIKEMRYLNQIISETLRLYSVFTKLNRYSLEDYVVPGHPNFVIPKGMPVIIPSGAIHRDADFYPNPDVFNPDNFLPELVKQRDSVQWLPFGDGPRNCVGKRFGLMQTRIGLAVLLRNFKFSVCEQTQIPIKYNKKSMLLCSESGIYLKVENNLKGP